jgi:small-conductance mechanosensitive channel
MTRDDPDAAPRRPLPSAAAIVERIVVGVLALALIVFGFFFLAAALVAGAVLAVLFLIRVWWLRRKIRQEEEASYLTTEYEVVDRERPQDPRLPPGA